ncbi:MAG: polymerase sigma-70 factor, subfamily [Solirubrobacteraceae bacterium]|nr:polymerase sigma-70 factor, subfamily [Solirubrobacteraceae bacterium]
MGTDDPFDDLLAAARTGAEWAWTRIYQELAPKVTGYLAGHGAADPENLTGEVFLQVVRGLPGFSGGERDFAAWTFTIAHRRMVDQLRRQSRRPVEVADAEAGDRGSGGAVDEEVEARLAEISVRRAIDELPADQRSVMLLRIIGDLTIEETARAVGKRPGAVKALQRRALRRLERAYPSGRPER